MKAPLVLNCGWNATLSNPRSPPDTTSDRISRNGLDKSTPSFMTRIRPTCSTMKSRPEPSPAPVTYTGLCSPLATFVSLNDRLSALGPLGVASTGEGEVCAIVGVGEEEPEGEDCEVGLEPTQPARADAPISIRASLRTLREV